MRKIKLTKGKHAIVDDDDYQKLSQFNWCAHSAGYAVSGGGRLLMHRLIMHACAGEMIDHINRNKLDNRKCNLRKTDYVKNAQNSKKRIDSTYGRVVSYDKRRNLFYAQIWVNKKKKFLGYFCTKKEARDAFINYAKNNFYAKESI